MRAGLVLAEKDLENEEIDWFTLDVLWFAEAERQREKVRRGALDVATRHPHVTFRTLLDSVAGTARLNRRYLRSIFGYDVRRNRWLRRRKPPESEHHWDRLWDAKR